MSMNEAQPGAQPPRQDAPQEPGSPQQPAAAPTPWPQPSQQVPPQRISPQPAVPPQPAPGPQGGYPAYYAQPQPVYAPVDPRTWWRTWRRKVVNRAMGLTLASQAILVGASLAAGLVIGIIAGLANARTNGYGGISVSISHDLNRWAGVLSLASVAVMFCFLLAMRRRDILTREFWLGGPHVDTYGEPNQLGGVSRYGGGRMTPLWAFVFVVLALGAQGALILVQLGFSAIGIDLVSPTSESIERSAVTVSMWLYIGLVGPICEEVLFRGILMKELKPLGRNFAIVTSALAFALYHDDVVQGVFAFLLGLLLGFIAMEYSLVWAIALHIFNNAVLSGVVDTIASNTLGDTGYMVYAVVLSLIGVAGAAVVFAKYGAGLVQYRRANRSQPDTYYGWTSWAFILFVALNGLTAVSSFAGAMLG